MLKVYIDMPVMAHKTFILSGFYTTDKDGNRIEIEEDFEDLQNRFPYNRGHEHVR